MATASATHKSRDYLINGNGNRQPVIPGANYSIKEAALLMGLSAITIWRAIDSGELGHFRLGRRILVGGEHLLAYRRKNERPAREA